MMVPIAIETVLHPAPCQLAQMSNDVNKVKVMGSDLAMDTLPRPGDSAP